MFKPDETVLLDGTLHKVASVAGHRVFLKPLGGSDGPTPMTPSQVPETDLTRPLKEEEKSRFDKTRLREDLLSAMHKVVEKDHSHGVIDLTDFLESQEVPTDPKAKLAKELRGILKEIPVSHQGHHKKGAWLTELGYLTDLDMTPNLEALVEAGKVKKPLPEFIRLPPDLKSCGCCGETLHLEFNGVELRYTTECPNPEAHFETEVTLNVPSGKLLVANDLRNLVPIPADRDINQIRETLKTTEDYAKAGCAYGFVGNTCPGFYLEDDGTYTVATKLGAYHEEEDEYEDSEETPLASICTDLWWYSIMDYDEALKRAEYFGCEATLDAEVVEVPAGLYKIQVLYPLDRDNSEIVIYARFSRVGEAVEQPDWISEYENASLTASRVLQQSIQNYPALYDKGNVARSFAAAAGHIMCTNGNGVDWHENGHPLGNVRVDIQEMEIPRFHFQHNWYPISPGYCTLLRAAGMQSKGYYNGEEKLNESFARLAFNILESMISYGFDLCGWGEQSPLEQYTHLLSYAVEAYYKLRDKYPGAVYPDFDAWMKNKKAVKRWVKHLAQTQFETQKRVDKEKETS